MQKTPHWLDDVNLLGQTECIRSKSQTNQLWCPVRKIWLKSTPEEWVRIALIYFLHNEKGLGLKRMSAERQLSKDSRGRFDLTLYNKKGEPYLLFECKAPYINYNLDHLLQLYKYNEILKAKYTFWTNGPQSWVLDVKKGEFLMSFEQSLHQYL